MEWTPSTFKMTWINNEPQLNLFEKTMVYTGQGIKVNLLSYLFKHSDFPNVAIEEYGRMVCKTVCCIKGYEKFNGLKFIW